MIVVDSSALVAIIESEPGADALLQTITDAAGACVSAATLVEAGIVLEARRGPAIAAELDRLISVLGIDIAPVDEAQAATARDGWRRYGKGRHPAALNYGDCFSYALAIERELPLLFKGQDFEQTDVTVAQW